jgi:hypothetical protein
MARRVDKNQVAIVKVLRDLGASVQCLHIIGHGCPDLAIGWRGVNLLVEVKNGNADLTPDERDWHADWRGQVAIVRTVADALALLGVNG